MLLIYNFLKKHNHTYFILNQLNEPQIRVLGVRTGSKFTFPGLGAVERYEPLLCRWAFYIKVNLVEKCYSVPGVMFLSQSTDSYLKHLSF